MSEKIRLSSILIHPLFSLRTFPWKPARLNLTPNLFLPQKHLISDWVRMCLSIVNEQLFFYIQENESKMSCRIITCLGFFVFTFPCAEGQFSSSTVVTNPSTKKTITMTGLMLFTTKRAKRAGCDLSKCEFGFGLCYTELSVAVSSAFMVLSK